ncbi:MAG: trypsin-like serine protease [bacterium]|nr:trypsin-like serine protease [bacterium]
MNRLVPTLLALCTLGAALPQVTLAFSAADVYRESAPGVVLIFGFNGKGDGSAGTGSIISEQGLILTNNHVIYDAKTRTHFPKVTVYFKPDKISGNTKRDLRGGMRARVVARDAALDLALIKVDGIPAGAQVMAFGDSEATEIGSQVAAIGHPGGGGLWTLTTGTISSTRTEGKRQVFQTDTAINPGNSGGPLLDENANLIGVNTYVKRVNKQGLPLEGLNYSLRSVLARRWLGGLGVEVTTASVPAARDRAPQASKAPTRKRAEEGARTYQTRSGEKAFGVPNVDFSLEGALAQVVGRAKKNAASAFDELDAEMDGGDGDLDLDDF